ncbi:MAG: hypothetical protein ACYC5Y_16110 [Symbiobacteriia bacterium]
MAVSDGQSVKFDVLRLDLALDQEETARRRAQIAKEAEDLWK